MEFRSYVPGKDRYDPWRGLVIDGLSWEDLKLCYCTTSVRRWKFTERDQGVRDDYWKRFCHDEGRRSRSRWEHGSIRSDCDRRPHEERGRLIRRLCDPCSHRKITFFRMDMTEDRVRRSWRTDRDRVFARRTKLMLVHKAQTDNVCTSSTLEALAEIQFCYNVTCA